VQPGFATDGALQPANVPLQTGLAEAFDRWAKVIGAMTVDWEGQEMTPHGWRRS